LDDVREIIREADQTEFDVAESYQFLLEQTNDYLKEKAIKQAIIDSVDEVEDPEKRNIIQKRIESAVIKDIKIDLGLRLLQ
jgi:predicted XRE-type DNA-binding protein